MPTAGCASRVCELAFANPEVYKGHRMIKANPSRVGDAKPMDLCDSVRGSQVAFALRTLPRAREGAGAMAPNDNPSTPQGHLDASEEVDSKSGPRTTVEKTGQQFPMRRGKHVTTVTLDERDRTLLDMLAEENGLRRTEIIRMSIRRLAKELGVELRPS